jgi:signal transduction histidine kinase/CHASE3 domain sensor protein
MVPMIGRLMQQWWATRQVQQKVWTILLVVFVPLVLSIVGQVALVTHLRTLQEQHHHIILAREQLQIIRRLAVDIEDAFRGYLLIRQDVFLEPMREAEPKLKPTLDRIAALMKHSPNATLNIQQVAQHLMALLESKHRLIAQVQSGNSEDVLRYVESGRGIALSDSLRDELRLLEDGLDHDVQRLVEHEAQTSQLAFWALLAAVGGGVTLGLVGARLLAGSITRPLAALHASVTTLGTQAESGALLHGMAIHSSDEIGRLAAAYHEMADRIKRHIQELETLSAIGHDINSIGVDGLDGVLRRITDSAAHLLDADACLVMSRHERMGCWIVEAASGTRHEFLRHTVMLWEEFPVSVRAFETKQPAIGERLRRDSRPEVIRRNRIGEAMLAIPLLSQGIPFGVLVLLMERDVPPEFWNVGLAKGFADEAAIAIANARLYEAAQEKGKGLQSRLRQLEHLAEMLAHDLKGPGERMEGFATMLRDTYGDRLDGRALRWLGLIEENGKELAERVQSIFELARVGTSLSSVEAVNPAVALQDVLKQLSGSLESKHIRVHVQGDWPMVACHVAYLRQVFENLLSNAIKFLDHPEPEIRVTVERKGDRVWFAVSDNGPGIPRGQHERVFQPFVRLDPERTKGSGIGLTIVRRIIELYGGQTSIHSEAGSGCMVKFSLPVLGEWLRTEDRAGFETTRVPEVSPDRSATLSKAKTMLPTLMTFHHRFSEKAADAELKEKNRKHEGGHDGAFNG